METRRASSECERPRLVNRTAAGRRLLSTPAQRNCGSLETRAATSTPERPRPARKASTASGLEGQIRCSRWEDSLRAAQVGSGAGGWRPPATSTAAADGGEDGHLVQPRVKEEEAEEGGLARDLKRKGCICKI
ncbi:hypothetical protein ZWY2020_003919 [Hordeum vulgare]|nr:hypothetical protein ZWY2020_003919 [Hordeum vulgare]